VPDRKRIIYYEKAGFGQNSPLFSSNSTLFSSNNEKFWLKPVFFSLRLLSRSSTNYMSVFVIFLFHRTIN